MVSEKTCNHSQEFITKISGTKIREILSQDKKPSKILMRPEISEEIIKLGNKKFISKG